MLQKKYLMYCSGTGIGILKGSAILNLSLVTIHVYTTGTDSRGGSRVLGKGGSNKDIHHWGRVREGACPLP